MTRRQVVNTFRRYGRTFLVMLLFAGLFVGVMWFFEVGALPFAWPTIGQGGAGARSAWRCVAWHGVVWRCCLLFCALLKATPGMVETEAAAGRCSVRPAGLVSALVLVLALV